MSVNIRLFCLKLRWSGARISELLAITPSAIDFESGVASIETLKRRKRGIVRQVTLPPDLLTAFDCESLRPYKYLMRCCLSMKSCAR
jgi:integrase